MDDNEIEYSEQESPTRTPYVRRTRPRKTQEAINEMISSLDWKSEDGTAAYMYRFYPGHAHTESDWNVRFEIPVLFMLGKK